MRLSLSQDNAGAALVFHPFLGLAMRLVNPDRGWATERMGKAST